MIVISKIIVELTSCFLVKWHFFGHARPPTLVVFRLHFRPAHYSEPTVSFNIFCYVFILL